MKLENQIYSNKKHKNYSYAVGIINITNQGYAFVNIKEFKKDIFIPKNKINRALEGDLVKIKLKKNKNKIRLKGEVIKIIKRKNKKFIGILKTKNLGIYSSNIPIILCNSNIIIHLDNQNESKKYNHNDKVLVKIIYWPKKFKYPIGKIIKVFGKIGEYQTEFYSLLEKYKIPYKFPKKIENEAKKIFKKGIFYPQELKKRRDLRKINTFTIDPIDAKDFDDAISVKKVEENLWEIGIHISDVTHYIKEGSCLDKEAYVRSSSIYLIGQVIPMLPQSLSDHLCSLKPEEDKLSFSFIFHMNKNGELLKSWIGKTIIRSNKKFTYNEVQKILDEKKGKFYYEIKVLFFLSKILSKKRFKNGSICLNKSDIKFRLDNNKNPIATYLENNKDSHQLIEEFMLLTNKKISEFVSLNFVKNIKKVSKKTYIYRIHGNPDNEKILSLNKIIQPLGYFINIKNIKNSINHLLSKIRGNPEQNMIENLILRTMNKAKYSTKNIGHYGLSFVYYTHFTSPIRRYSDIIAHRLLYRYLKGEREKKSLNFYEKQSQYCSYKEKIILDLERDFIKYMQVKFLKNFLGKTFYGIITGITEWSIYVDLTLYQTEGMIKLRDIKEDYYTLASNGYSIIGKNKKKIYSLGDKIKVELINVDLEKSRIILNWIN